MKAIAILAIILILVIIGITIGVWKRGSKAVKHLYKVVNKEKYANCIPTWPSKCFDCDAHLCSGQHKSNSALASSGLANLGRM